ncbi:MAG: ATP-dependent Clp protease ATP-binding subunit [Eubacteriales bacterium]|nr:ATP-dependent Clp protease ATP-binding subunit [Eubacteriales bacterium]
MSNAFTASARTAINQAKKIAQNAEHPYVGTEHLLAGLLKEGKGTAAVVLRKFKITEDRLMQLIDKLIAPETQGDLAVKPELTPRAQSILYEAEDIARMQNQEAAGTEHILLALVRDGDSIAAKLLHTLGVSQTKIYSELLRASGEDAETVKREVQALTEEEDEGSPTPFLDRFSRDLTELARNGKLDPVVGRTKEINRVVEILSRRKKNNPCLIGEPGVGKTAIVEGLAQQIVKGLVPDSVKDKRLLVLDMSGMVAGSKYRGEFEERMKRVLGEVMNDSRVLLFIDEMHTIIGAGGAEGALDASNILKPSLARGEIQLIGATTLEEYRKHIEKDAALERRFQPVTVDEPGEEETMEILRGLRPYYEEHHGVQITDEAVEAAVKLSTRYVNDRFQPDKSIDLMDEAAAAVQLRQAVAGGTSKDRAAALEEERLQLSEQKEALIRSGEFAEASEVFKKQEKIEKQLERLRSGARKDDRRTVSAADIAKAVSVWTKIPVERIAEEESQRLAKLEEILRKRVVGQEEAVKAVAKAIRRGRVGLKDPKRPIGSFLFLGPTGVGKTELSKALAEAVFGSENAIIRVDMSEYMEKHSVSKLIGSPPGYVGYEEGGQLSEKVRRNPYSVLLFDEIEKAHPDVFNILLQVLDDGHITDATGRKISFRETVIIMTSNAGANRIVQPKRLGFLSVDDEKLNYENMKMQVMEEVRQMFRPEFLNRIDDIQVFHSLTREDMKQIVQILLQDLKKRCREQMQIDLQVSDESCSWLIDQSFDSKYGARPLKRKIQTEIEDLLAEEILDGKINVGDTVLVSCSEQGLKLKNCLK